MKEKNLNNINMINKLRLHWKLFISEFCCIDSFCKECGVKVRDFIADDEIWDLIEKDIKHGYVLCYNCFVDKCEKFNINTIWKLVENKLALNKKPTPPKPRRKFESKDKTV